MEQKKEENLKNSLKAIAKNITSNKLYLVTSVLLLSVFALIIVLVINPWASLSDENGNKSDQEGAITFLPTTTRTVDEPETPLTPLQVRDPFSGVIVLRGVITGGKGGDLAVIETGSNAYVIGIGDPVAGDWTVVEIKKSSVLLTSINRELLLELGGKASYASIEPEQEDNQAEQAAGDDEQ